MATYHAGCMHITDRVADPFLSERSEQAAAGNRRPEPM